MLLDMARAPWNNRPMQTPTNTLTRSKTPRTGRLAPGFDQAVATMKRFLKDGEWHCTASARRISRAFHCEFDSTADGAGVALSDSGRYVCAPRDSTPAAAPDEGEGAWTKDELRALFVVDRRRVRDCMTVAL